MPPGDNRMSAEQRKLLILEAVLNVFAQKGSSGARTKEISREARGSQTVLLRHLSNKDNL